MMNPLFLIIILNIFAVALFANNSEKSDKELILLHFNHGDSISLRWIPTSEELFTKSAVCGYYVQRRKKGENQWNNISGLLKPLSNQKMELIEAINFDIYPLREIIYKEGRKNYIPDSESQKSGVGGASLSSVDGEESLDDALLYAMATYACDISLEVAKAAAVLFVDKNIDKNTNYEYRVVFSEDVNKDNANVSVISVNTNDLTILPEIDDFSVDFGEDMANFSWTTEKHVGYYSAYRIERSTDGKSFKPLKKRPSLQGYTTENFENVGVSRDSFPNQDDTFYYRMAGYSPFGFYGPYSKVFSGKPKFNFKHINIDIDTIIFKDKYTEIKWNVNNEYKKRIKGLQVMQTRDFKSFKTLNSSFLPNDTKSYKDYTNVKSSNYYAIVAYGYNKDEVSSFTYKYAHFPDTVPPSVPTNLKAVIDSAGVATISWNKCPDIDIFAYRLYASNSGRDDDFFSVNSRYIKDTFLIDTISLNTLTKNKFYKVSAIDKFYNESALSKAFKLSKIDTVAPVGAAFALLEQNNNNVIISWQNSPSDDAVEMELYRQIDDTGKVVLLKKYDLSKKKQIKYVDKYEFSGEIVQYFMIVRDDVGNETKTSTNRLTTSGERPNCIKNLKYLVVNNENEKYILLNWEFNNGNINRFVIYRKMNDERMLPIASLKGTSSSFIDKDVKVGEKYKYIIRPISSERVYPVLYSDEIIFSGYVK